MNNFISHKFLWFLGLGVALISCNDSKNDDYSAYFGGEIINPKDKWVLLYQGEKLIDSIPLDQNNRFLKKFDSLPSGLYTFRHEPEYQYVHFEKNDSLMVRINTFDFDESLVFCGKGEEKNNFLVEMYLKNQKDRNNTFSTFDLNEKEFLKKADSSYQEALKLYNERKQFILWSDDFDVIAKASVDYPYYAKKEFYTVAHKKRNMLEQYPEVSSTFYDYHKNIDFNSSTLSNFSPYLRYISTLVDNLAKSNSTNVELKKLQIIDSLTSNQEVKNRISSHIAFFYLMEKENNANDSIFLNKFYAISTDSKKKEEIKTFVSSIKNITKSGYLPNILLKDAQDNDISSEEVFNKKTIVYFWSKKNTGHFLAVHKKLDKIIESHPEIDVVGISLDENLEEWKAFLKKNNKTPHHKIRQYRVSDFKLTKEKWAVTRVTRASVVDKKGKIINGFVNLFDATFEKGL